MPNLRHLLDDLSNLDVEPEQVRIPGRLYDDILADAESSDDEDED